MVEPEVRTSRIAIALGFLAVLAVGGGGFLAGRGSAPHRPLTEESAPEPVKALPVALPSENPSLSRADLLLLATKAADAFATGTPLPQDVLDAAGRRFDFTLPFGCGGPSEAKDSAAWWTYDRARGRLRIGVTPTAWQATDWNIGETSDLEGIEGFWIARPWSSSGNCPPAAPVEAPTATAEQDHAPSPIPPKDGEPPAIQPEETLAIAQFFSADGTHGIRRAGRPYSIVTRIAPEEFDASQGFRTRLTGRIERTPKGEAIQCVQPKGREQRPACLIATVLDEVRIENAATGATLATWRATHSSR